MARNIWLAQDGSWGSGDVVSVDTTQWTDEQWDHFESATDYNRGVLAREWAKQYGTDYADVFTAAWN